MPHQPSAPETRRHAREAWLGKRSQWKTAPRGDVVLPESMNMKHVMLLHHICGHQDRRSHIDLGQSDAQKPSPDHAPGHDRREPALRSLVRHLFTQALELKLQIALCCWFRSWFQPFSGSHSHAWETFFPSMTAVRHVVARLSPAPFSRATVTSHGLGQFKRTSTESTASQKKHLPRCGMLDP